MADKQIVIEAKLDYAQFEKGIGELDKSIQGLENDIKSAKNTIKDYEKAQKELNEQYKAGAISTEEYTLKNNILNDSLIREKKSMESLNNELKSQKSERTALNRIVESEIGSYTQLQGRLTLLNKAYKELSKSERENVEVGGKMLKEIDQLNTKLKDIDATMGNHQRNVGNYKSAFDELKNSMGFGGINLGAAGVVTAVAAIGTAYAAVYSDVTALYNQISKTYKATGDDAKILAQDILVLRDYYGADTQELIKSSQVLINEFGLSSKEAFDLIEQGFDKGANANGEFMTQLKEYPAQLKATGLAASEVIAVMSQFENMGVFDDKAIDSLKEGHIRLSEYNKATEDSLKPLDDAIEREIKLLSNTKTL
jgi:phage-related minor tail protein